MPRNLPNLLARLNDIVFPTPGNPVQTGRGVDLIFGSSGTGLDSAGPGRDIVIGSDSEVEVLTGGKGADVLKGGKGCEVLDGVNSGDIFVATKRDVIVFQNIVDDGNTWLHKPAVVLSHKPADWSSVSLVFADLVNPSVTDVSRSGLVSVEDRFGQTVEIQLQGELGESLDLAAREARVLERRLQVDDTDAPILAGTVWNGQGSRRDEVLFGGEVITGRGGRDLLVADGKTEEMKGGRGEDMLVSDTRGVMMDGGRGVDLYVLTGHAQQSATTDPDCLAWDIVGQNIEVADLWDFVGTNSLSDPAYENDVLWLTDLDAASVQVHLSDDGAFVFRDSAGVTAEVMFENRAHGPLGADDLDHIVGRVYAGADAMLLEADQFIF